MDENEARRAIRMHERERSPEEIADCLGVPVEEIDIALDLYVMDVVHALDD